MACAIRAQPSDIPAKIANKPCQLLLTPLQLIRRYRPAARQSCKNKVKLVCFRYSFFYVQNQATCTRHVRHSGRTNATSAAIKTHKESRMIPAVSGCDISATLLPGATCLQPGRRQALKQCTAASLRPARKSWIKRRCLQRQYESVSCNISFKDAERDLECSFPHCSYLGFSGR